MKTRTNTGGEKEFAYTGNEEYDPDERNEEIRDAYAKLDEKKKKLKFYLRLVAIGLIAVSVYVLLRN